MSAPTTAEVSINQGHKPVIEHWIRARTDPRNRARAIQGQGIVLLSNIRVIYFELAFLRVSGLVENPERPSVDSPSSFSGKFKAPAQRTVGCGSKSHTPSEKPGL